MRDFRQGNREGRRFGGPRNFESRGRFNRDRDSDRGRPRMHDVECSKCGKQCQVPFRPTGERPVFCSECFRSEGETRSSFRPRSSESAGPQSGASIDQLKQINAKLDRILLVLQELDMDTGEDEDILEDSEEDSDKPEEEVA